MPLFFADSQRASHKPGPPPHASTVNPPQNLKRPSTLNACLPQIGANLIPLPRIHLRVSRLFLTNISTSSGSVLYSVTRNISSKNWSSVYVPKSVISHSASVKSGIKSRRSSTPLYTVRIAPAVNLVFPPPNSSVAASKTSTFAPASSAAKAEHMAALPAPTTTTSYSIFSS